MFSYRPFYWLPAGIFLVATLAACVPPASSNKTDTEEPSRTKRAAVRVVASTSILAHLAEKVGGKRADVVSLVPPGADVHTYQAKPRDAESVVNADIVFQNGSGLDAQVRRVIEANLGPDVPNVVLSEGIESVEREESGEAREGERREEDGRDESRERVGQHDRDERGGNPHVWLDPNFAIIYVERIRDGFIEVDPKGRDVYQANSSDFVQQIRQLDQWIEEQVSTIPEANRKLVTAHDAFGYFARRYGFERVGFVTRSPEQEPNAGEVAELVTRLKDLGVRTVFREPQIRDRVLQNVAAEAGVSVGELYSDSLNGRVTTYVEMMRFNTAQLVEGLR